MVASRLDRPLVFVDIETNGLSHLRGRIIEVAAIRVERGQIVRSFKSLVDPESELPHFITRLTGITANDLKKAPTFDQIADELQAVLNGAVFVAHNVRFDYSFLKQEFGRLGLAFLPKQLCTVKLSRALFPHEHSHKLEDLIRRHGFNFGRRHRAYDDAAILWQFIRYVRNNFPPEQVEAAVAQQLRQPAMPKNLPPDLVRNLPEACGVYIFEDKQGRPLYVGKSINIKQRVLNHFGRDHAESKEFKIAQSVGHVRGIETAGELGALLLESRLVKELQPLYNRQLRRTQTLVLAKQSIDEKGYLQVTLEEAGEIEPAELPQILAVYQRRSRAREALEAAARDYELCPKLLGAEKTHGACFWQQLRKCRGACAGLEAPLIYNRRLSMAFERQRLQAWPYGGPVLIEESKSGGGSHVLVVDQWCVVGEMSQEPHSDPVLKTRTEKFDLDTYKILQSYLATKLVKLKIQSLRPQQLAELMAAV